MDRSNVILGLGSNVGDRSVYLRAAVAALSVHVRSIRLSSIFESAAVLPDDAPPEWNLPYYNMALIGQTPLSPLALLAAIKNIETNIGRTVRGHWAPREIDIDILALGEHVFASPSCTIPHPLLLERDFALLPLTQIAPHWAYPAEGVYKGWAALDIARDKGFAPHAGLRDTGEKLDV